MNESEPSPTNTPLELRGAYLVQFSLLASLILNSITAVSFFAKGAVVLGLWAALATFLLPRAILALLLIVGRQGLAFNLTRLLSTLYGRTIKRYEPMNYETYFTGGVGKAYAREGLRFVFWSVPLVTYLFTG